MPFDRPDGGRLCHYLPVIGVLSLITLSWLAFTFAISIKEVLLHRHDVPYFIFQAGLFHILLFLTVASYVAVVAHRPLSPDLSLAPPDARPLPGYDEWDENSPPDNTLLDVTPPVALAPVPRSAPAADDDDIPLRLLRTSPREEAPNGVNAEGGGEEEETALLVGDGEGGYDGPIAIMAKSNTGGPRWCRKCDAWKPDRCHHCRACGICVLKMDHHCPWVANCIGYHNHKFFVLFITYGTLLSLFGASQAGLEAKRFFQDPSRYDGGTYPENDMEALQLTFTPVLFLLLAIVGGCMTLALGGLACYHWYLMLNNRTTLEDIDRSPATPLLDASARATLEALGPRGSRQRAPGAWRPDHILTRPERTRLRREAREINVYDLGWSRNVRCVMVGDSTAPASSWKAWATDAWHAANPLRTPRMQKWARGHVFAHDREALRDLKALTREVRLGLPEGGRGSVEAQEGEEGATERVSSSTGEEDRVPPYRRYE